jgi:hypothetical protein
MKKLPLLIGVIAILLGACKGDDTAKAKHYLNKAEQLLSKGELNAAKLQLDSVHLLFPRLIPMRQAADTLMYKIELVEAKRSLLFADSILPSQQHFADSLAKGFKYEKNAKYEDVGKYTYKTQTTLNVSRTYLKSYVTEKGEMTLTAVYCGAPIGFNKVKCTVNDLFAETFPAKGDSKTTFTNEGQTWENVSFTDKDINGVDAFIAHNIGTKITILLEGGKRNYSYIMADGDKQAITKSYYLAEMWRNVERLKREIIKSKQKIAIVCQHLRLNPQEQLPPKFRQ